MVLVLARSRCASLSQRWPQGAIRRLPCRATCPVPAQLQCCRRAGRRQHVQCARPCQRAAWAHTCVIPWRPWLLLRRA